MRHHDNKAKLKLVVLSDLALIFLLFLFSLLILFFLHLALIADSERGAFDFPTQYSAHCTVA